MADAEFHEAFKIFGARRHTPRPTACVCIPSHRRALKSPSVRAAHPFVSISQIRTMMAW